MGSSRTPTEWPTEATTRNNDADPAPRQGTSARPSRDRALVRLTASCTAFAAVIAAAIAAEGPATTAPPVAAASVSSSALSASPLVSGTDIPLVRRTAFSVSGPPPTPPRPTPPPPTPPPPTRHPRPGPTHCDHWPGVCRYSVPGNGHTGRERPAAPHGPARPAVVHPAVAHPAVAHPAVAPSPAGPGCPNQPGACPTPPHK
jgi:hypothetical protein